MEKFNLEKEIVKLYPELKRYSISFFYPDIQEAEDLLNDTIDKILRKINLFEEGTDFKNWCYSILRNNFINSYRKKIRCRENMPEVELDSERALTKISEIETDHDINFKQLLSYVDELPKTNKICFQLMVDGYQYDEISEKLNVPIGTVKSRIFLSRKFLMKKINEDIDKVNLQKQKQKQINIMAPQSKDKTEALKAFFAEIFQTSGNHWTSVKDKPLTPIQRKHGLDHNWGGPINKTMQATMWFSVEGERSSMRYRCFNASIPDYDFLAAMTIKHRKEAIENYSKSDTKPLHRKQRTSKELIEKSEPQILPKRKFFNVDEIVYTIHDNCIVKGVVIESRRIKTNNTPDYIYEHVVETESSIINEVVTRNLFTTPEICSEALLKRFYKENKK